MPDSKPTIELAAESWRPLSRLLLFVPVLLALGLFFSISLSGRLRTPAPAGNQPSSSPQVASSAPEIKLSCPVPPQFCEQAKIIDDGESFYALGYNLPVRTPLLAAFVGKVEDEPKIPDRPSNQPLLYLRDDQGNEAVYSFYGVSLVKMGINLGPGGAFAQIGEGSFPPAAAQLSGLNFFMAVKKDGKFQKITTADFAR